MAKLFNNIGSFMNRMADAINGTDSDEATETPTPKPTAEATVSKPEGLKPQAKPEAKQEEPAEESQVSLFNNAIDKRDRAVRLIVNEFREASGTTLQAMASLYIFVITESEDYDMAKYAWADDTMLRELRLSLDNAMLDNVGRRNLEIKLITAEQLPEKAKPIVEGALYYSFVGAPQKVTHTRARITLIEGTGSLAKDEYLLDTGERQVYHIGRGAMSRKPGAIRPNDIVICDNDPDQTQQMRNNHVSSAHADIVAVNGRFFLKALRWGCRTMGGASTKLIYDDSEHELRDTQMHHPLRDNYIIELGKEVCLVFNILNE